jgi:hypothetical protein
MRQDLLGLPVSEVSVCGKLSPLLWACCEAEHHGSKNLWWNKVAQLMVARKQKERERDTETGREGEKGPWTRYSTQVLGPSALLPPARPFYHLPKMPSNCASTD